MSDLRPKHITWAVLLGRWVDFARSALALPNDAAGRALRAAVPDLIALQAVTMALGELGELEGDERALGLDRARVLIDRHTQHLRDLFGGEPHAMIRQLITDAEDAYAAAVASSMAR